MQKKLIIFSIIFFLSISAIGSATYAFPMQQGLVSSAGSQLSSALETERVMLEAVVNAELAIALKMAKSPLIRQYMENAADPDIKELEQMAFKELIASADMFSSGVSFWINDYDKNFYFSSGNTYVLDPDAPVNYWYNMTLYETEVYNFNINYNPEIDLMSLWINVPVFDSDGAPLGLVGGGINLTEFIDNLYGHFHSHFDEITELLLFNSLNEITAAKDLDYIENKITIDVKLGELGKEILSNIQSTADTMGETTDEILYFELSSIRGVAAIGSIEILDWYIVAFQPFRIGEALRTGMTVLLSVLILLLLVILVVFNIFAIRLLRVSEQAKLSAEKANATITESINYASKIQKNLLPPLNMLEAALSDHSVIWQPRDIVGGDIYWARSFDDGVAICVCDCTGHGIPGAMLTMLAVSACNTTIIEKRHTDTAQILYLLDQRLSYVLNVENDGKKNNITDINDGCDIAVFFISKDGTVTMSSAYIDVLVCDGKEVSKYNGQKITIGDGKLTGRDDVKMITIPANPNNKFYIATDGLADQIGEKSGKQFGKRIFSRVILDNHNEKLSVILAKLWTAFEEFRGGQDRRDDIEIISFKP